MVAAPAPATVNVSVLANQTVRTVDGKVFGINQVAWDPNVNTPASAAVLNDIGATCLRWPGGSWGDGYHWANEAWNEGSSGPRYWGSFSRDFIALATNTHSDAFIIVNYGTGTPEEAAYGVRMFNITNQCNFKYWEVGNEIGGSWEWDWQCPGFRTNDILNLPSLASKLKTPTNNISTYLRSQLSSSTLSTLDSYISNPSANAAALRWALVNDLNNLMYNTSQSIYKTDTNRFVGITFRAVTWTNLSLPVPPIGQDLPNRMTIEDAYPELAKLTPEVNWASNWPNIYLPHDPWTYAMRFTNYYAQMKAADPTIKIGALADVFEDGTVNYTHHPVVNPRTGQTQYGWNPVMLTYLRSNNCIPDFLIVHDYGPTAGDTQDLLYPRVWASHAASLRRQLTDYLGDAATNVTLEVTESGMGGDKQYCKSSGRSFLRRQHRTDFTDRVQLPHVVGHAQWRQRSWRFRPGVLRLANGWQRQFHFRRGNCLWSRRRRQRLSDLLLRQADAKVRHARRHGDPRHERLSVAGHVCGQTNQWRADAAGDQQELRRPISRPISICRATFPPPTPPFTVTAFRRTRRREPASARRTSRKPASPESKTTSPPPSLRSPPR